jgi:thioredoxin 1
VVLAYFYTEASSVCMELKLKVAKMITEVFPKMKMVIVESDKLPELAAQNRVFFAPTLIVFFDGRETIRESRSFGIEEMKSKIQRPYSMLFE